MQGGSRNGRLTIIAAHCTGQTLFELLAWVVIFVLAAEAEKCVSMCSEGPNENTLDLHAAVRASIAGFKVVASFVCFFPVFFCGFRAVIVRSISNFLATLLTFATLTNRLLYKIVVFYYFFALFLV